MGLTLLAEKIYIYAGVTLVISLVGLLIFCKVEMHHPEAVLPLYLMKNPVSILAIG